MGVQFQTWFTDESSWLIYLIRWSPELIGAGKTESSTAPGRGDTFYCYVENNDSYYCKKWVSVSMNSVSVSMNSIFANFTHFSMEETPGGVPQRGTNWSLIIINICSAGKESTDLFCPWPPEQFEQLHQWTQRRSWNLPPPSLGWSVQVHPDAGRLAQERTYPRDTCSCWRWWNTVHTRVPHELRQFLWVADPARSSGYLCRLKRRKGWMTLT